MGPSKEPPLCRCSPLVGCLAGGAFLGLPTACFTARACVAGMNAPSADLRSLLDRLKGAQYALIDEAAQQPGLPSTAAIHRIAELEMPLPRFWP